MNDQWIWKTHFWELVNCFFGLAAVWNYKSNYRIHRHSWIVFNLRRTRWSVQIIIKYELWKPFGWKKKEFFWILMRQKTNVNQTRLETRFEHLLFFFLLLVNTRYNLFFSSYNRFWLYNALSNWNSRQMNELFKNSMQQNTDKYYYTNLPIIFKMFEFLWHTFFSCSKNQVSTQLLAGNRKCGSFILLNHDFINCFTYLFGYCEC